MSRRSISLGVVLNHSIWENEDGLYCLPKGEAKFIKELSGYFDSLFLSGLTQPNEWIGKIYRESGALMAEHVQVLRLANIPSNYERRNRLSKARYYFFSIINMFKTVPKADVWYVFLPGYVSFLFCTVCLLFKREFGVYIRGDWESYHWVFRKLTGILLRNASFAIVTGLALKEKVQQVQQVTEEVYPMTSFELSESHFKTSYEIEETPKLLFVGTIVEEKGVFDLVDAISLVNNKRKKVKLFLVGPISEFNRKRLEEKIREHSLENFVKLVGYVDDPLKIKDYYLFADIFVFPSKYSEGFPRVIYEAMAVGLPIVSTRLFGVRGVLRDGVNFLGVDPEDPADIARKLNILISDQKLREMIGREAIKTIQRKFFSVNTGSHAKQVVYKVRKICIDDVLDRNNENST